MASHLDHCRPSYIDGRIYHCNRPGCTRAHADAEVAQNCRFRDKSASPRVTVDYKTLEEKYHSLRSAGTDEMECKRQMGLSSSQWAHLQRCLRVSARQRNKCRQVITYAESIAEGQRCRPDDVQPLTKKELRELIYFQIPWDDGPYIVGNGITEYGRYYQLSDGRVQWLKS